MYSRTFLNTGAAIEAAVKAGFRSIDCAHAYLNEPEIGEALHRCIEPGVVKREELFITSKLWYVISCTTALNTLTLIYTSSNQPLKCHQQVSLLYDYMFFLGVQILMMLLLLVRPLFTTCSWTTLTSILFTGQCNSRKELC